MSNCEIKLYATELQLCITRQKYMHWYYFCDKLSCNVCLKVSLIIMDFISSASKLISLLLLYIIFCCYVFLYNCTVSAILVVEWTIVGYLQLLKVCIIVMDSRTCLILLKPIGLVTWKNTTSLCHHVQHTPEGPELKV